MTLNEVRQMSKETITPAIAAKVLGCDPMYIRLVARKDPARLGFPTLCIGSRVKIPRLAFIRFMEGGAPEVAS